jgi:ADP-ribose pyrophosphatase YjhB (NUDIX family)
VIKSSLEGIGLFDDGSVDELSNISTPVIGDDLKRISDAEFNRILLEAKNDTLTVFSTTSQLSSGLIETLLAYNNALTELNFFIVSPFVKSDSAVTELSKEYKNPYFAIPAGQFVTDDQGRVDEKIDILRRVLKILSSIRRLAEFSLVSNVKVDIRVFRECYPGIKIKYLSKTNYIQIQPGPLNFANNLYRFGIETHDAKICRKISLALDNYKNDDSKVGYIDVSNYRDIEIKVVQEISLWLLENGVSAEDIMKKRRQINAMVNDPSAESWMHAISKIIAFCRSYPSNAGIAENKESHLNKPIASAHQEGIFIGNNSRGEKKHLTVAALFVNQDKILLIKKSDPAYHQSYSIPAGHINNGESPNHAIKREVLEELGISIENFNFLSLVKDVRDKCRYDVYLHDWYLFHTTIEINKNQLVLDKSEINDIFWVKISDLHLYEAKMTFGCKYIFQQLGYI